MNRFIFMARNFRDKLGKVVGDPETARFYYQTYVRSRFSGIEPDVYIVSYPKCGRTWMRVFLLKYAELLGKPSLDFEDKKLISIGESLIIKFEHDQGTWVPAPCPLEAISFRAAKYAGKKVLFLVRDPRDVLVSSWYHLKYRERIYRRGLSEFVRDDLVGIEKVVAFMNMWIKSSGKLEKFLLVLYEDLHRSPLESFGHVIELLGIELEKDLLARAVEASGFEKMKEMETRGSLEEPWLRPGSRDLGHSLKVRKGQVGSFRDELSPADIAYVNDIIRRKLDPKLLSLFTAS